MSEEKSVTQQAKEYWDGFQEAPFSDSFKWVDKNGFEHLSTVRGWSWGAMVISIEKATMSIVDMEGRPANVRPPQAIAPQPDPAAKIAMEAGNKVMAQELQIQAEAVPPAPNGGQWNIVDVTEVRIEPKADGLVSVEFWNPGRQYAEEYVKWQPDRIKALLKHVMTVPVNDDGSVKPAKLSCRCRVFFSLGKEKTGPNAKPGSRWHDVAHVRPL